MARIIFSAPSVLSAATPIAPSAPALDTAAAMAGVEVPAMGAWKIGHSRPIFSSSLAAIYLGCAVVRRYGLWVL